MEIAFFFILISLAIISLLENTKIYKRVTDFILYLIKNTK